ncbi:IclR family transcriptional regulator [Alicyclobacillus cycloheptanicus]|uniref:DNA-binding IclR family transcriptional regulator n=1 Tax=Alicyclobacillus cycloheptanicus TaxID=1457 RepID=A0ABT9XKA3_9BACL|nr:IclR family transcriptional regulator [Alicyclobacillus cycloheptanicus]MDQ0190739.1 DNA-binding IclR family transcriptional regulator [Alicyclobacillus cycloheptanicus]
MQEDVTTQAHATVRAVDRALDILLCFGRSSGGLTLSEISKQVNLHKSTVYRLLTSLQVKGFVRRDPDSDKYFVGWSVLELLSGLHESDELSSLALPEMTRLRDRTGETVSLYVRVGRERLRIQAVDSQEPVRNVAIIGKTYPLYIGASGKVLLAFADSSVLEQVFQDASMPPDFDREDLLKQLAVIRRDGYATSIQERDTGAAAAAAPVFDKNHELVASLSVSGPVSRFTPVKMQEHIQAVKQSAVFLTKLLSR